MKTNQELQTDVQNAIKWEPLLHAAEIGVTAKDGVVSLTGVVDSYAKKMEAENATKKVIGVRALVEQIEVKFHSSWNKSDAEVANEVLTALKSNWSVPKEKISVKVEKGWVTLEGDLPWNYQREAAKNAVSYLVGVKGVSNNICIKSETHDAIEKRDVENAIERNWAIDDSNIRFAPDADPAAEAAKKAKEEADRKAKEEEEDRLRKEKEKEKAPEPPPVLESEDDIPF
jgi:osmotically-inducible protein OsmY